MQSRFSHTALLGSAHGELTSSQAGDIVITKTLPLSQAADAAARGSVTSVRLRGACQRQGAIQPGCDPAQRRRQDGDAGRPHRLGAVSAGHLARQCTQGAALSQSMPRSDGL